MTSQPGKLTNTINNYTHFPISHQVNHAMKFGQVTEYNKRNIIFQKSCRKVDSETDLRPLFCFLF